MPVKGLPRLDRDTHFGRGLGIRYEGFGVWATGETKAIAFANWQQAVKEAKASAKLQQVEEGT